MLNQPWSRVPCKIECVVTAGDEVGHEGDEDGLDGGDGQQLEPPGDDCQTEEDRTKD